MVVGSCASGPQIRAELTARCCTRRRSPRRARCGPITVPNHKLLPGGPLGARAARGRRARALGPHARRRRAGPRDRGRPPLVREAPGAQRLRGAADGTAIAAAPAGHALLARIAPLRGLGALLMCGIAGLLALPGGAPARRGAELAAMSGGARAPRPRRRRATTSTRPPGSRSAGSRSSTRSAAQQPIANEDGTSTSSATASSTTTARCGARLERRGHRSAPARTSRCSCTSTRSAARRSSTACAGCSRSRCGTRARRRLVLARDPFGIKPLVYARLERPARLRVRAEGAARAAGLPARRRPATRSSATSRSTPSPRPATIFRAARKLRARAPARRRPRRRALERYARPRPVPAGRAAPRAARRARGGGARAAGRAPCARTWPPTRPSACCSPAASTRAWSPRSPAAPLQTFSVGFDVAAFDELAGARAVAERYGTDHHELRLGPGGGA